MGPNVHSEVVAHRYPPNNHIEKAELLSFFSISPLLKHRVKAVTRWSSLLNVFNRNPPFAALWGKLRRFGEENPGLNEEMLSGYPK